MKRIGIIALIAMLGILFPSFSASETNVIDITTKEAEENFMKFYEENGINRSAAGDLYEKALIGDIDSVYAYKDYVSVDKYEAEDQSSSYKIYTYEDGSIRKVEWSEGTCSIFSNVKECDGAALGVADGFHSANYSEDYTITHGDYDVIDRAYGERLDAWNPLVVMQQIDYFDNSTLLEETSEHSASVRLYYEYAYSGEHVPTTTVYGNLWNTLGNDEITYGFYED